MRHQLDLYGISTTLGPDAYYETPGQVLEAYNAGQGAPGAVPPTTGPPTTGPPTTGPPTTGPPAT